MNFNDIFKSSFLDNVSAISVLDMLMTIVLSVGIGLILLVFVNKKAASHPYMVVLNCVNHDAEVRAKEFLEKMLPVPS